MRPKTLGLAVVIAATLAACSPYYDGLPAFSTTIKGPSPIEGGDIGAATYKAVDRMLDSTPAALTSTGPIVVGSISDIRDVDLSGPFGNLVADLIRTRLVQKGLPVTELRLRAAVHLDKHEGEMMLARNRRALMPAPEAAEIVTGTYAVGVSEVYVSLKLISAGDARILGAADFTVPRAMSTDKLLLGSL